MERIRRGGVTMDVRPSGSVRYAARIRVNGVLHSKYCRTREEAEKALLKLREQYRDVPILVMGRPKKGAPPRTREVSQRVMEGDMKGFLREVQKCQRDGVYCKVSVLGEIYHISAPPRRLIPDLRKVEITDAYVSWFRKFVRDELKWKP